jgi:hypothetical protein
MQRHQIRQTQKVRDATIDGSVEGPVPEPLPTVQAADSSTNHTAPTPPGALNQQ